MEQAKIEMAKVRDFCATLMRGEIVKFQTNDYHRMRTRVNAYLQIAIFLLLLSVVIIAVFASTLMTIWLWNSEDEGPVLQKSATRAAIGFLWLMVVGYGIEVGLQLLAAIRLLKSTAIGIKPLHSLKLSSFWHNVTLVFLVVDIVIKIMGFKLYFWGTLFVLLRLGFLVEVYGFRTSLEKKLLACNCTERTEVPEVLVNKR